MAGAEVARAARPESARAHSPTGTWVPTSGTLGSPQAGPGAEADIAFGTVVGFDGNALRLDVAGRAILAERAPSCLVRPRPGDRVLVAQGSAEAYVLAVVRANSARPAALVFEHGLTLEVLRGKLSLHAREGLDLATEGVLTTRSDKLDAEAREMRFGFATLEALGDAVSGKVKRARLAAETIDTLASRIFQRAVNFLRRTDELDRVEAKSIDRKAQHLLHVHGENVLTTADELVKIDGAQVHVG